MENHVERPTLNSWLIAVLQRLSLGRYTPIVLALFVATISALRIFGPGRDYVGYESMFNWARSLNSITQLPTFPHYDVGFGLLLCGIALIAKWPDPMFFFLVALPVLSIKFWCFQRYSPNFPIAVLGYLSMFFVVHEYTQLRVGSAMAMMMLATGMVLVERKRALGGLVGIGAVTLHLSSALLLPFIAAATVSLYLLVGFSGVALFSGTILEWWSPRFDPRTASYIASAKAYPIPNPFSTLKIYQYVTVLLFLYFRRDICNKGWVMVEYAGWFLLVGLAFFFGAFSAPVLAHRFSELFTAFMPFLMAGLATLLPRKWAALYVTAGVVIGCWSSYGILR